MRHYYKSFALTIRPRAGITNDTILAFKSWLSKQDHSVAVTEMEGEARHLHAQLWLNEGRTKDDISKAVKRICERTILDWDATQTKVLRGGIRIAYSDWYLEYLVDNEDKGEVDNSNIITNNPPDRTEHYYPSEEEQEKVKQVSQAADPRFLSMEQECNEWLINERKEVTYKNIAQWLCNAMFNQRTMKVLVNQRDRTALCKTLYAYMSKTDDISYFVEKTTQEKNLDKKYENLKKYIKDNPPSVSDESEDEEDY
uniref:hypothetical protein n=1 Tax=Flavobacterium sp. TaxID=239 RepID=UPI00404AACBE